MKAIKHRQTSKTLMSDLLFIRGEYNKECPWDIAPIKACHVNEPSLQFLSYQSTKLDDIKNVHKAIHFFANDQKFEGVYN
jgi:hypothetical protein